MMSRSARLHSRLVNTIVGIACSRAGDALPVTAHIARFACKSTPAVSRPGIESHIESVSESSFEDPATLQEYVDIQREGFDRVARGDDPNSGYVTDAPELRIISMDDLRRLAAF